MDREAAKEALERVIAFVDYDLSKQIDEPEDEFGDTWDDLIDLFIETYEKALSKSL